MTCDPMAGEQRRSQLVQQGLRRVPTDPSQPFGNAGATPCAARTSGRSIWRRRRHSDRRVRSRSSSASRHSICSTTRTSARRTATAARAHSGRLPRPRIPGSSSSGSSCCGKSASAPCCYWRCHGRAAEAAHHRTIAVRAAIDRNTRSKATASPRRWARISSSRISSRPKTACSSQGTRTRSVARPMRRRSSRSPHDEDR